MKDSGGLKFDETMSKNISLESYALAVTNLAICVLCFVMMIPMFKFMFSRKLFTKLMFLLTIFVLNTLYSTAVIMYYDSKKQIDKFMHDISMSMVIIGSVLIVLYFSPYSRIVY